VLTALTDRIATRPRRVLLAVLAFVLVAAGVGTSVFTALEDDAGFLPADAESMAAVQRVETASGTTAAPPIVVVQRPSAPVASPAGRAEVARLAADLAARPGVAAVTSAASPRGDPRLVSTDGRSTYLAATLRAGADEDAVVEDVIARYGERADLRLGGEAVVGTQLGEQISEDLGRAEALAFPLLLLLSILFFRGARAALLPLAVGVTTVLGTFLVMRLIDLATPLSIFAINLVIGLGLGLAIDYTLFLVTRYREEIARRGEDASRAALRATMATAGRTVVFSALTVAVALATLVVFPLGFLQSMGIGGAAVALVAGTASLVVTPALLALWGPRLARGRGAAAATVDGRWYRIAHGVMRRPGTIAALTTVVMVALTLPALRAAWTPVDATAIPRDLSSRQVADALERDFPRQDAAPVTLAVAAGADDAPAVRALADRVGTLPGAREVAPPTRAGDGTWVVQVTPEGTGSGPQARSLVAAVRAQDTALPVLVGGEAAEFLDQQDAIGSRLPLAVGLLAVLTFVLLWLMTGSVVLPLKALVMNALTVGATLGVLTLVFQDGRLQGLLGYTANGGIEPSDFLVTATLVFALSTDYGVFLLGRIKEARDGGLDDREAVAVGLAGTGRVVTAAAILLAVAIGAFVTSGVLFIKQIGVGTAVGVLVDAFVVRALLVPSLMALLGSWNWWSPAPLRRLHARIGFAHEPAAAEPVPGVEAPRPVPVPA
jgi:RND superfamily putative drug exporter